MDGFIGIKLGLLKVMSQCKIYNSQVEEVSSDLQHVKGEQCIIVRTRDAKIVLTNPVSIHTIDYFYIILYYSKNEI